MLKLRIIFVLIFLSSFANAQTDVKEHSLNFIFEHDLERVDSNIYNIVQKINGLATYLAFPSVSKKLLDNYTLFQDKKYQPYYNYFLGVCNTEARNYARAKELLQRESNDVLLPYVLEQFGIIYSSQGNLDLALKYYKLQAENTEYDVMKGRAYRNVAVTFKQMFQLDSAVVYLNKSSSYFAENQEVFANLNLISLAQINRERGFNLEAKRQLKEVLNFALKRNENRTAYESIIQLIETHEDLYEFDSIPSYTNSIKEVARPRTREFDLTLLRYEMVYSPVDYNEKKEKLIHYKNALKIESDKQARSLLELSQNLKLHDSIISSELMYTDNFVEKNDPNQDLLKKWIIGLSIVFALGFFSIYSYNRNNVSRRIKALQKERQELHRRIEKQNRELTDLAINLKRKRQFDEEFLKKVEYVKNSTFSHKEQIAKLSQELKNQVAQGTTHEILQENINELNSRFEEVLSEKHPNLTSYDKELCGLVRLNFTNKEIANLKNISTQSARTAKYRLKQKLELEAAEDLVDYLQKL